MAPSTLDPKLLQELFEKIDQEADGEVYLREVVLFLRAVNEDVDKNEEASSYFLFLLSLCL